jgi:hypothetical protein
MSLMHAVTHGPLRTWHRSWQYSCGVGSACPGGIAHSEQHSDALAFCVAFGANMTNPRQNKRIAKTPNLFTNPILFFIY